MENRKQTNINININSKHTIKENVISENFAIFSSSYLYFHLKLLSTFMVFIFDVHTVHTQEWHHVWCHVWFYHNFGNERENHPHVLQKPFYLFLYCFSVLLLVYSDETIHETFRIVTIIKSIREEIETVVICFQTFETKRKRISYGVFKMNCLQ